ncbi:MAG: OB-fold protein [Gemmata sp.]
MPAPLPPRTGSKPAPVQPKKADPKLTDEEYQKQVLEEIAKDRIKEAIRNGPGLPVSAENLDAEFQSNVIAAELKYKDKVLEVTGKVARVTRETGQTTVTLELVSGEGTKTVNCTFAEKAKYTLAQAERGQNITVRGLCTGRINKVVQLKDCVVAK